MPTIYECLESLNDALNDFCFEVRDAIREDIRALKQKIRPIKDEKDPTKLYREVWPVECLQEANTTCDWCDNGIERKRMVWEPETGNIYEFCPSCGLELELVIEEEDLPKLSDLEIIR